MCYAFSVSLSRYKDQSSFKLAALQKQVSESVPATHLEAANRQFSGLTAKYRDLLQKEQLHSVQVEFVKDLTEAHCIVGGHT